MKNIRLRNLSRLVIALLIGATGLLLYRGALAQTQDDLAGRRAKRSTFMRMKLEYSKNLLEALTTEDFDKITANAKALKAMSLAAEWEVPEIPNVQEYLTYSAEFQRLTDDMKKAAERKSIDGSLLNFNQLNVNCVKCHQYVRFKRN
ncbi:MAG: hypothetical protein ACKO85_14295 [Isosphaeraceae bacterium]